MSRSLDRDWGLKPGNVGGNSILGRETLAVLIVFFLKPIKEQLIAREFDLYVCQNPLLFRSGVMDGAMESQAVVADAAFHELVQRGSTSKTEKIAFNLVDYRLGAIC